LGEFVSTRRGLELEELVEVLRSRSVADQTGALAEDFSLLAVERL